MLFTEKYKACFVISQRAQAIFDIYRKYTNKRAR